jgi:small subunit ribosomal protein S8
MVMNDPLSNMLSSILNSEKVGKNTCVVRPVFKLGKSILKLMKDHGYIKDFEISGEGARACICVVLTGRINKCGVIKPRFAVGKDEFERYERRFLPSKDFGIILISTSKGIMTHNEAKEKGLGGRLIAYVY